MNKFKKLRVKLWLSMGIIVLVAVIAVVGGVKAYQSYNAPKVVVEGDYIEAQLPPEPAPLGAVSSPDIEYQYLSVNGDATYHLTGTFINASTTIVSVPNPFLKATSSAADVVLVQETSAFGWTGATSTVELMRLNITGAATSTFEVACASAPTAYATSTYSYNILTSDVIATSSTGIIENNLATTYNQGVGGGSVAKIMLTPSYPYLLCKVGSADQSADVGGFTGDANTFDGTYTIRISRQR